MVPDEGVMNASSLEFWEDRWRSGHTPWDHGEPAPPFLEFVERFGAPEGRLLLPGCGRGHDARLFAKLGAEVTAIDIAPSALKKAQEANPHARATYLVGDILALESGLHGSFDWVAEHTCLCAMDPVFWEAYAQSVRSALRPGGNFLGIFYINPHDDEGPPHKIEPATIDALFGEGFRLVEAFRPTRAYDSRIGREEVRWYRRRE